MKQWMRKIPALFLIVAMLVGLVPPPAQAQVPTPSYNPYQGIGATSGRYDQQYGQRYDPNYYQSGGTGYSGGHGFTRLVPQLVGAVMGLAVGAKFGLVGMAVGGALGFFGGKAISSAIFGDSYYQGNQNYYFAASNRANFIPGAIGAMVGAFLGSSFGVLGMVVGGGIGYLVAKGVAKMVFPNLYYGGVYNSPGYNGGYGYGYPYAASDASATAAAPASPGSSVTSGKSLSELKDALYQSMSSYKEAMEGDNQVLAKVRRAEYLAAQQAYFDAKRAAGQE